MPTPEHLREYATGLSDEALIDRLREGGLTEEAAQVTREELESRSVNVELALAYPAPTNRGADLTRIFRVVRVALIWAVFLYSLLYFLVRSGRLLLLWTEASGSDLMQVHPVFRLLTYFLPSLYLVGGVLLLARSKLAVVAYIVHPVMQVGLLAYFGGLQHALSLYTTSDAAIEVGILASIIFYTLWLRRRGLLT